MTRTDTQVSTEADDSDSTPTVVLQAHVSRPGAATIAELVLGALLVVGVPALLPFRDLWAAQFVLVALIVTAPGTLLLRALTVFGRRLVVLAVPASVVVLLAVGLAVNVLGPLVGLATPLRVLPLVIGLEVVCLALLVVVGRRALASGPTRGVFELPSPAAALPLLLPLLGLVGALRLNAGGGAALAVVAAILVVVTLVALIVRAERATDAMLGAGLYGMALAFMWSFSMRSESVYGFDIITEFRNMMITVARGQWYFSHPGDAYGAMLSVTVLPAEIHEVTGLPVETIVKVVYPALFALVPVLVFAVCRRFVSSRWSFVGAAFLLAQANFGQQLPSLAKQEIALLIFASLLYVLVHDLPRRRVGLTLAALFAAGIVVTHYSTSYTAIFLLGAALTVLGVLAALRRRGTPPPNTMIVAFVVLLLGAVLWNGVLTGSAKNVTQVVDQVRTEGLSLLPNRTGGLVQSYLAGNVTPTPDARDYEDLVVRTYQSQRPYVVPLPNAQDPRYALTDVPSPKPPLWVVVLYGVTVVARQLVLLVALVAAVRLLSRNAQAPRQVVGASMVAAFLAIVGIRLSGTLAASYNQDRALLQALVVLVIGAAWLVGRGARRGRRATTLLTSTAAVVLTLQLGLVTSVLGVSSGFSNINLSSSGEDAKRSYIYRAELVSAEWLMQNSSPRELVYADRYGSLRYLLVSGRYENVYPEMVPPVVDRSAWVYATATNIGDGSARSLTDGQLGIYGFPKSFFDENFDTVYSNGYSTVFHRQPAP